MVKYGEAGNKSYRRRIKPEAAVCGCVELVGERGRDFVLERDQTVCLCVTGTIPVPPEMCSL